MSAHSEGEVIVPCPFGCPQRLRFPWKPYNLRVTCPRCRQTFTWTPFGIVYDERFERAKGGLPREKQRAKPFARILIILLAVGLMGSLALYQTAPVSDAPPPEESPASETAAQQNTAEQPPSEIAAPQNTEQQPAQPVLQVAEDRRPPTLVVREITPPKTADTPLPVLPPPPDPPARYEVSSAEPPTSGYRLPNGTHIEPPSLTGGRSVLQIENGTAHDVAVKLVLRQEGTDILARFVYIQSGERVLLEDIEPGVYLLAWCSGSGWNPATKRFEQSGGCFMFEKPLVFTEGVTREGEYLQQKYTVMRVTLHTVIGGNVTRQPISEEAFHSL